MKSKRTTASMLAGLIIATTVGAAAAGSLAGSKGDSRYPVYFPPGMRGECVKAYKDYVAASGHSAYASTLLGTTTDGLICGVSFNVASQKAAEAQALKLCQSIVKKYKIGASGQCSLAASK